MPNSKPPTQPDATHIEDGQTPCLNMASAAKFLRKSDEERMEYALYAEHYGQYAAMMSKLYPLWRQLSWQCHDLGIFRTHKEADGKDHGRLLTEPHLTIGFCPPRALGYCRRIADHGGFMQITIRTSLFDGTYSGIHKKWYVSPGVKRLVDDILLHEMVHQYHFEITGTHELKQGGHGKKFRDTCNQISEALFIPESQWIDDGRVHKLSPEGQFGPRINEDWKVYVRRRGSKDTHKRVANHWPMNIRPDDYYGPDVEPRCWVKPEKPRHIPTWCMVFENLVAYYEAGEIDRFVQEARTELKKFQDANCPDCVDHWASLWDEPVCKLEALKAKGLPGHWLGHLPSFLNAHNADAFDPLV